jgi:hypothetical protein
MSLNDIELPGFIIAGLYKNTLVAGTEKTIKEIVVEKVAEKIVDKPAEQKGYKFLGNNNKKITFIVNANDAVFLPEKHLALITKLLEACKMNIGDVAIVNHFSTPVIINDLKKQLTPETLVLFGVEPTLIKLPISFPQFKTQAYDGCTYLYSPSLTDLEQPTEEGKLLKSKLWVCLRKLFEV